jgi:uncharacterized protein YbjT (DUF2867 family)
MNSPSLTVLVVGATGSVGRHVVAEALDRGHRVRALARDPRAARFPSSVEVVPGDLTAADPLAPVVESVDAIVFTHGTRGGGNGYADVDYGGVRNILTAVGTRPVRIALMTAIGVTDRASSYNRSTGGHDWKRRSERLVRASGHPYTIVRPGWFDYNGDDQHTLHLLQGDTRHAGSPADGVIARRQIAQVLVTALTSDAASRKTFELVAEHGPAQPDLEPLFTRLEADPSDEVDGVKDAHNLPVADEPAAVRADLEAARQRRAG